MPAALETDLIGLGFGAVKGPQVMVTCRDPCGNELVDLEAGGAQIGQCSVSFPPSVCDLRARTWLGSLMI